MKRHNRTENSIPPCSIWSIWYCISTLCVLSTGCKSKINSVQTTPAAPAETLSQDLNKANYPADSVLRIQYSDIINAIRAKSNYGMFAEFLERGKYSNILLRLDMMNYIFMVPSDASLKKLDNATLTQLIYPDVPNQNNLNFLFAHVAFGSAKKELITDTRTMANKIIKIDETNHKLNIDGRIVAVQDEASLPPSVKLYFIDEILN